MANQSDVLKPYVPSQYPKASQPVDPTQPAEIDPAYLQRWDTQEHDKLRVAIGLLVQVVKQLDARMTAHGF